MSAAWETATCPRCGRAAESSSPPTGRVLPHNLGVQREVKHRHGAGNNQHTWVVRWLEDARVTA